MTLQNAFSDLATAAKQDEQTASLGTDGASPPSITGTGIRGWLRGIYEKLAGTIVVSGPITNSELRATPIIVSGTVTATPDDTANMVALLRALVHPVWEDVSSGRLRVVLDPAGGAQTLGTVTTVGTVTAVTTLTNQSQIGAIPANTVVLDTMHAAWLHGPRRAIS